MSAIAARRRLLRPRHRLAVGLTLLASAGMVVLHHSAMPGMASMPGEGICLAVLALGAACALVAGAVTRRATARLRPPSQPFDRAFIDMMIPHHQGAIRMVRSELASRKNARLRVIAKSIVPAQAKEITQMTAGEPAGTEQPHPPAAFLRPDPYVLVAAGRRIGWQPPRWPLLDEVHRVVSRSQAQT